jgi:hypothetical protein
VLVKHLTAFSNPSEVAGKSLKIICNLNHNFMFNITSSRLQTLLGKNSFTAIFATSILLLQTVGSLAQSASGTGLTVPGSPLAAPQQFTTNLIAVNDGGNVTADGNIAILDNTFSNDVDASDGVKILHNPGENFDLMRDGIELVLEQRKLVVKTDTLFYQMSNLKAQNYLLEFYPINMNLPGLTAILVDKYLNVRTPVNLNFAPVYYPFLVNTDAGSFGGDRFMILLFQADFSPLPVNFISIAANKNSNGIQVNWKVAAERNILNYSVEKSANGRNFTTAGTITVTGYSDNERTYSFTDDAIQTGTVFYRIKSNGNNSAVTYSAIVKVATGSVKAALAVSPNPVAGNMINLQLIKSVKGKYEVNMVSTDGRLVYNSTLQHVGGDATFPLSLPSSVAKGTYILNVITPDKIRQAQALVVGTGK